MTQTTNYKLNKIETNDEVLSSITAISNNMEIIDENLYKVSNNVSDSLEESKKYTEEYVDNLIGDYETAMNDLIEGAGV